MSLRRMINLTKDKNCIVKSTPRNGAGFGRVGSRFGEPDPDPTRRTRPEIFFISTNTRANVLKLFSVID